MQKRNVVALNGCCTGCSACALTCARQAITIQINSDGFFHAKVDEDRCTGCGKCQQVCLKQGATHAALLTNGTAAAAQSQCPEVVNTCTSGGIAYELSCHAISIGMTVAGVVYDYSCNRARTVLVDTLVGLQALKGSKYLQSDCAQAFSALLSAAQNNLEKRFLVFGTPCQIYGFSALLEQKRLRDRFVLVDLFCHGVPSYLLWDSYLESLREKIGGFPLNEVTFRDKSVGWHNFVIRLKGDKGTYKKSSESDLYYHAYFDNVLLSEACFHCDVRKEYSAADLRLGDYWGKRYQSHEDGISAVLMLTPAGKSFFKNTERICVFEETTLQDIVQAQSVHDYQSGKWRAEALKELRQKRALKKVISGYRRYFSLNKRIKLAVKEATVYLPDGVRVQLKKIYKSL